jgi:DNA-binding response OmpR family regulator
MATILIIDDDQKLNELLKGFLSDFGFGVLTATHPEKGLKKLKQKSPDLVILDVMLPGMDGFEVCRKIRHMLHTKEQLLLDVSHELRSPLTRVKVALEFLPEDIAFQNQAPKVQFELKCSELPTLTPACPA